MLWTDTGKMTPSNTTQMENTKQTERALAYSAYMDCACLSTSQMRLEVDSEPPQKITLVGEKFSSTLNMRMEICKYVNMLICKTTNTNELKRGIIVIGSREV